MPDISQNKKSEMEASIRVEGGGGGVHLIGCVVLFSGGCVYNQRGL